jgi:tetratricopeptide (TPR) repeat protein
MMAPESNMRKSVYVIFLFSLLHLPAFADVVAEGKVITAQGKVEYLASSVESWASIKLLQSLFPKDRVHTATESKAAILFRDETQVRLNANAELLVRSLSDKKGTSSVFELLKGEGWFRTKNPSSDLHVATPTATAAIRGTEINVRIGQDDETILTVVEGKVEFSNDVGSITVLSGEEASAKKGQAPTKRVIVNPEDAVQWVIYYPAYFSWQDLLRQPMSEGTRAGFGRLQGADPQGAITAFQPLAAADGWARIGLSMAFAEWGDYENARQAAQTGLPPAMNAEGLSQLAAIAIAAGDIGGAKDLLDAAKKVDPANLRALVLSATVSLAQNRKEEAQQAAKAAVAAHPDSVTARIVAGETSQAFFDLPQALASFSAALKLDPNDVRALVDRARVRFGMGDKDGALKDTNAAIALAPNDAQVLSLHGFIQLSSGRLKEAQDDFNGSVAADPANGEPYLGLGLVAFKQRRTDDGLWQILTATLLDPKISLYQSYLGKAYCQVRRFTEGLAALDSAERLDPRDPTPRLYKSLYLRDLYRYVDSLDDLTAAIALNDNRAVYRSRLLLDQDLATKNVSLAQVYDKVGLEAWGVSQALDSLNADFTNSSAHLFLTDLYGQLPDRLAAQQSEFLQYLLFSPVNQNSFASFDEYTTLFEQPSFSISPTLQAGAPAYGGTGFPTFNATAELSTRSGNDFFTHFAMLHYKYQVGARPDAADHFGFADLQMKLAFGLATNAFLHLTYNNVDNGAGESQIQTYGSGANQVSLNVVSAQIDPDISNTQSSFDVTAGLRHDWAPGFPITFVGQFSADASTTEDRTEPSTVQGVLLDANSVLNWTEWDAQAQQSARLGNREEIFGGLEAFGGTWQWANSYRAYLDAPGHMTVYEDYASMDSETQGFHAWVWNEYQPFDWLHLSAEVLYQADLGHHLILSESYAYNQLYPGLGVTLDFGPAAVLRMAAFQYRTARLFGQTVRPMSLAGFLLDRNEENYTFRTEAHIALDDSFKRFYLSNHFYYRESDYPPFALILLQSAQAYGVKSDLNWVLDRSFCLAVSNQGELTTTQPFTVLSDEVTPSLVFTHQSGLTVRLSNALIIQRYLSSNIPELADSLVDLLDLDVRFDFPRKHGYVELQATNILNQGFTLFTEAMDLPDIYPYLRVGLFVVVKL